MPPRNPLGTVSDAAVGVIATCVRAVASLINSAAGAAKGLVGMSDETAPKDTIESVAAAAVEREMQQEPAPASTTAASLASAGISAEAEAEELLTPSGIPAAGPGTNPDTTETDLHQRDTEPLLDPATVKAVKSETDTLRAAADLDKG